MTPYVIRNTNNTIMNVYAINVTEIDDMKFHC